MILICCGVKPTVSLIALAGVKQCRRQQVLRRGVACFRILAKLFHVDLSRRIHRATLSPLRLLWPAGAVEDLNRFALMLAKRGGWKIVCDKITERSDRA